MEDSRKAACEDYKESKHSSTSASKYALLYLIMMYRMDSRADVQYETVMYAVCSTAPADAVLPDRSLDATIFEMVDYMFHRRQSTSVTIWSRTVVAMSEMGMSYLDVNAMHSTNVIDNSFLLCSIGQAKPAIALYVVIWNVFNSTGAYACDDEEKGSEKGILSLCETKSASLREVKGE